MNYTFCHDQEMSLCTDPMCMRKYQHLRNESFSSGIQTHESADKEDEGERSV